MQTFQELHAVYAGEPDIQQDERGLQGVELLPQALRIGKCDGLIPLVLQDARYGGSDGGFVVYYANRVHIRLCLMFVLLNSEARVKQSRTFVKSMP
jgi:hypothetical protein